jgi:hypothetical protein
VANGQTMILASDALRHRAKALIDLAPDRAVVNIREQTRTSEQNDKMWAMLSDIARAKPLGRVLKSEGWKALFMDMIDKKPSWEPNLDGSGVVCIGYKSSHLTKPEMSDLIEQIYAFGAEHGVEWSEPAQ